MPNHRVHDIAGIITSIPMSAGVYTICQIATDKPQEVIEVTMAFCASHILSTFFLSPDMDIGVSRIYNRWGIFRFLWYPYHRLVPHRSDFSHSVVGGLLRMMYILILCAAVAAIVAYPLLASIVVLAFDHPLFIVFIFLGSASASWIHVILDKIKL